MMWKSPTLTFEIPESCYGTRRQRHVWPAAQYDLLWTGMEVLLSHRLVEDFNTEF